MDVSEQPQAQPQPEAAEIEEPRDILAAEAFALGAPDPGLHREEAHDVLAADEFPVPAAEPHAVPPEWQVASGSGLTSGAGRRRRQLRKLTMLAVGAAVLAGLRRRRRTRAGTN